MKKFLLTLGMTVLAACSNGPDSATSLQSANGPVIVPATYRWCEGAADKLEDGYVTIGIHNFAPLMKIALYASKTEADAGGQPTFKAEWSSKVEQTMLLDTLGASPNLQDPNADLMALFFNKIEPEAPKVSGFLLRGHKNVNFSKISCEE